MKILHALFLTLFSIQPLRATPEELSLIDQYKQSLPLLVLDENKSIPESILQYVQILGGGKPLDDDGHAMVLSQITKSYEQNLPIKFVILGFPEKSANTVSKSLAGQFDLADLLGLSTLSHLCSEIEKIYHPGAHISIVCDEPYLGEMSDYLKAKVGIPLIPQESTYHEVLKKCLESPPFKHLELIDSTAKDYQALTLDNGAKIPADGLIKFISHEIQTPALKDAKVTNKQRAALAREMAEIYEKGVEKLRYLVENHPQLGSMIRLSVHGDGKKLHMNLIHGCPGTPWHGVVELDPFGRFHLTSMEKAQKSGAKPQSYLFNGQPMGYVASWKF